MPASPARGISLAEAICKS